MLVLALVAGIIVGLWRGSSVRAISDYQKYLNHYIQIVGVVADDPTFKNNQTGMKLNNVQIDGHNIGGQVWVGTTSKENIERGYHVSLSGKLQPGFGNFATTLSFAKLNAVVPPQQPNTLIQFRDNFAKGLQKALPQPQADLGLGYLTGQHNTLPQNLIKQLQLVGLIHLVIAGGYNVTILVRFARRRFVKISRYLALYSSFLILLSITLMSGFSAPISRTFIITTLSLAAWYLGRRVHPLVLLPFAAAITAAVTPSFVWGDVGWYLTFVAYGGLILLGPIIKQYYWGKNSSGELKQIIVDTVAVQIVTMPILALAFHQYSIYGLLANLLVLPVMSVTMMFTALAGLAGMAFPVSVAHIAGWPANQLLSYTVKIANKLADAPGADASANFNPKGLIFAYALIIIMGFVLWRKTHYNFRTENVVE